jgi:site-specific DNA-methyltransferase (adenine-specific)
MNRVHLMDCMDFMKDLPDKRYDLAIVDPPYGIGVIKTGKIGTDGINKKDGYLRPARIWEKSEWDNKPPVGQYFTAITRISRDQIIWGGNYFTDKIIPMRGWIVWDKCRGMGNELAVNTKSQKVEIFRYMWNGEMYQGKSINEGFIMQGAIKKREKIIHPTQKPVALYKWLLTNYAKPGQTIFDSHVGSGSLRIACHDLGFDFEGCEIDKEYWEAQEARYQNHIKQAELFDKTEVQRLVYKEGVL